jgi:peptidoglycan hydrolase CwlO-like protein
VQTIQNLQSEITQVRSLVAIRDADIKRLQEGMANESRRLGESHTHDRYSLELELDRLKRDLARCEDDLKREKALLQERELALANTVRSFPDQIRYTT